MKLESARIAGFRSISDVTLSDCGGFNVIIGKNNAGKSNILLALHSFFVGLRSGDVVSIEPPIGRAIDRHNGGSERIRLTLTFQLSLAERDSLIQDIVAEAPQVKNTVEGIDPELRLQITVVAPPAHAPFSFVHHIALCSREDIRLENPGTYRTILRIDDDAAQELASRAHRARQIQRESEYIESVIERLGRMDPDEFNLLRSEGLSGRSLRYFLPGYSNPPSAEVQAKLDSLARAADSLTAFRDAAQAFRASLAQQVADMRGESLMRRVQSFSGEENAVPGYALRLLERVASLKVLYLTERREPIGRKEAALLLDLKVRRGGPEKLRNIQSVVSDLLGVEIDAFRADAVRERGDATAELDVDRFLVQLNGAGIREALRLVLDYEFEQPDILLVEEPEIHLHPALETSMMRYLKTIGRESQIFITTHSANFLDTADMRNVYLASRNGSTKIQLIDMQEAENSVPRELGIRLSSLFMYDRLIFVEGPTDEEVLRELAAILGINLARAGVGFVSMGGVRNLAHFAVDRTISFLAKRRVELWFLLDRDERDEPEIQRLADQLGDQARLKVLGRREIENYLVLPRALAVLIRAKQEQSRIAMREAPTPAEVAQTLADCAEQLKQKAVEYRVVKAACPVLVPARREMLDADSGTPFPDRVREQLQRLRATLDNAEANLPATIEFAETELDRVWSTRKLELVQGDLLLDCVCKRFGVRFKKERDSAKLASLLEPSEVAWELHEFLKEVSRVPK